jgi:hypothetical protein
MLKDDGTEPSQPLQASALQHANTALDSRIRPIRSRPTVFEVFDKRKMVDRPSDWPRVVSGGVNVSTSSVVLQSGDSSHQYDWSRD